MCGREDSIIKRNKYSQIWNCINGNENSLIIFKLIATFLRNEIIL